MKKISIITVSYNSEKTIEDTINSVYNQSFKNVEHIVIDGDSNDLTKKIVEKNKSKISKFISEKDKGLYDAMNKGINLSNGEIIGLLNSDDVYYNEDVLKNVIHIFDTIPEVDVLYGDLVYVERDNLDKIVRYWRSKNYYKKYFDNGNVPPHPTLFIKKNIYRKNKLFNINFKLAADYEFMLRLFKTNNLTTYYLPQILIKMRLGGVTNKKWINRFKQNIEIINSWKINNITPPKYFLFIRVFKKLAQYLNK